MCWLHDDLRVSALDVSSRGLGSSPDREQCVVFLGMTLYSHSASLHLTEEYEWMAANCL